MSKPIDNAKDARLAAGKMHQELKLAEASTEADERNAAFDMATVRCRKISEYLQNRRKTAAGSN